MDKSDLEKKYKAYKDKKQQYSNVLYLKETKQKESIDKIRSNKNFLEEIGIELDDERLTDNNYVNEILEKLNKYYISLLTITTDLLS